MWKRIDSASFSILISILVSATISIGIAVVLMLSGLEPISAIIIALLSTIITILLDILLRVRFSESLLSELLNLYQDPWLFEIVKELIRGYRETVKRARIDILLVRSREILERAARELVEVSNGRMITRTPAEEHEMLIKIIQSAKKEICAVVIYEWFDNWWATPAAQTYLEENRKFIAEKKGSITRILIVPKEKLNDLNSKQFIKKQLDHKIDVRIACQEDQSPSQMQAGFMIADDIIASRSVYSVTKQILGSHITTDPLEIRELKNSFTALYLNSTKAEVSTELTKQPAPKS